MQHTVTYQSVLEGALKRLGNVPAQVSLERKLQVAEFIADRLRDAWEYYAWPETLDVQQRFFRPAWSAGDYAAAAEVYHAGTDAYYQAAEACTAADVPGTSGKWSELTAFARTVDFEQAGQTAIEACLGAWDADPESDPDAVPVEFALNAEGVLLPPDYDGTSVWLQIKTRCPDFAWSDVWSTAAFDAGSVVYRAPHVYLANAAAAASSVPGVSSDWTQLEFPYRLARAVKAGATAEQVGADGSEDTRAVKGADFIGLLEEQVWQLTRLQGQTKRPVALPTPC